MLAAMNSTSPLYAAEVIRDSFVTANRDADRSSNARRLLPGSSNHLAIRENARRLLTIPEIELAQEIESAR
jgi:hypothetical protein